MAIEAPDDPPPPPEYEFRSYYFPDTIGNRAIPSDLSSSLKTLQKWCHTNRKLTVIHESVGITIRGLKGHVRNAPLIVEHSNKQLGFILRAYSYSYLGQLAPHSTRQETLLQHNLFAIAQQYLTRALCLTAPHERSTLVAWRLPDLSRKLWEDQCVSALSVGRVAYAFKACEFRVSLPKSMDDVLYKTDLICEFKLSPLLKFGAQIKASGYIKPSCTIIWRDPDPCDLSTRDFQEQQVTLEGVTQFNLRHGLECLPIVIHTGHAQFRPEQLEHCPELIALLQKRLRHDIPLNWTAAWK